MALSSIVLSSMPAASVIGAGTTLKLLSSAL